MTQGKYSLHADCQANTLVACAEKSGSHSLLTKWLASGTIRSKQKVLIGLAFSCALGVTFLVLACALPQYNNWWPMFVLFFYVLSPLPTIVARRLSSGYDSTSSACIELCIFLTTGIVMSSVGLPVVLAHVSVIQWGACALVISGNVVVFLTIFGYFKVFGGDDVEYSMW